MSYFISTWLLLLFIATGCDSVTLTQPIGKPASITELRKLQGTWINDEQEIMVVHVAKTGNLTLAGLSWDKKTDKFKAENMKLFATHVGNSRFLSMAETDTSSKDEYIFSRYEHSDNKTIHLYYPVISRFQQAVESGKLEGHVMKQRLCISINLLATVDAIETFLSTAGVEKCFETEPSMVLTLLNRNE